MNKTRIGGRIVHKSSGRHGNGARRNGITGRSGSVKADLEVAIQRYSDLYEFAPFGYVSFDRAGRVEQANLAACQLLDRKRDYLIGAPFALWVLPKDFDVYLRHLVKCRAGERRVESNLHLKKHSGEVLSVLLSSTPTSNVSNLQLYQTAIIDLTERERADQALREKEAELEQIVTQTPFMLTRCTRDLHYRYASRAYAKMLGRTSDEFVGKSILEIMGKSGWKVIRPYVERVLAGETVTYEMEVPFANGHRHFLRATYVPDKDRRSEVTGWVASLVDITEQKQAEQALRDSERRYREMIDALPAAVYTTDAEGRLTHFNQKCVELSGRQPELGTDRWSVTWKLYHPDGRRMPHDQCPLAIALKEGRVIRGTEAIAERPDGTRIWFTPYPTTLRDARGQIVGGINMLVEITARKEAERQIRESEERMRAIIEQSAIGVTRVNLDGRILLANPAFCKIVGYSEEELLAKTVANLTHPDDRAAARGVIDRLRKGLTPLEYEKRYLRKDRSIVWVSVSVSTIRDRKGRPEGGIGMVIDITERKRTEAAAMRLAAVVRSSNDAIVAKDLNGTVTDWNEGAERIFGYSAKEIIGKSILTVIPPNRHSEETYILNRIRRGESIDHYNTVRRRKDGMLIDVSLTISPVKDGKGKIIGISKIARDITAEKQTARRLAEQAHLLDLTNDAILVRDARDRIIYWNHGAKELYGYTAEEALGKISHTLLQTEHPEPLKSIRRKLYAENRWSGEIVHRRKDGAKVIVMSRWSLDRDANGRPASILETNNDITQRKRAEAALQRSKVMLEQLVQQRTKALRMANAELQNEIIYRKGLESQIIEISDREQERLGRELHDGLCQQLTAVAFMARAAALRLKDHRVADPTELEKIAQLINRSVMDARSIAHDLHQEEVDAAGFETALRDLTERKIWKTRCGFRCEGNLDIEDDRVASEVFRILREGVTNANKHARATEIVVEACRRKRELIFSVTDNGIGLDQHAKKNGGLGFHIMQYRAHSIGARLKVESPRRGGTRLAVHLPLEK